MKGKGTLRQSDLDDGRGEEVPLPSQLRGQGALEDALNGAELHVATVSEGHDVETGTHIGNVADLVPEETPVRVGLPSFLLEDVADADGLAHCVTLGLLADLLDVPLGLVSIREWESERSRLTSRTSG